MQSPQFNSLVLGLLVCLITKQNLRQTNAVRIYLIVYLMAYNIQLLVSVTIGTDCKTL